MKIYVDKLLSKAILTHNNQEMFYNLKLYCEGKTTKIKLESKDFFITLDAFTESLNKHKQKVLWDFYVRCRKILDDYLDIKELEHQLKEEIKNIAEVFPMDRLVHWYEIKSGIPIPDVLKTSIDDLPDKVYATADQTYLRKDYVGLCGLALAMTILAPVFADYSEKTRTRLGNNWRNYYTFKLIERSSYYHSKELERLKVYVTVTVDRLLPKYESVILSGMSQDEFATWMLASVVAKKVACGDISGDPEIHPLIKIVHKYIKQRVQAMEKDFHGMIKHREINQTAGEDNKISLLEAYSSRQSLTDNLIVICEHYLENVKNVVWKIDPTVPESLIEESLSTKSLIQKGDLDDGPITLLKWVINKVIPCRIIDFIDREAIINAMVAVRTVLWHQGKYDLAGLVSALPFDKEDVHIVTGTDKRNRVVKDLSDKIDEVYPYYRKSSGSKKSKPIKSVQIAATALEEMFTQDTWYLTLPEKWLQEKTLSISREYSVSEDLRLTLIDLALDIART